MAKKIYDRRGQLAPIVTEAELRRHPGRFWRMIDSRGAVGICQDGETIVVALSLDQFVSILFGIQVRMRRKKRQARKSGRF